jgi:hypothetical protein
LPVLLPAFIGDPVVSAPGPLGFIPPIGGDTSLLLQPFVTGIEGGFFEFVLFPGTVQNRVVDLKTIGIAPEKYIEDNGVRMAPEYVG